MRKLMKSSFWKKSICVRRTQKVPKMLQKLGFHGFDKNIIHSYVPFYLSMKVLMVLNAFQNYVQLKNLSFLAISDLKNIWKWQAQSDFIFWYIMNFTEADVLNNFIHCFRSIFRVYKPMKVVYFNDNPRNIYFIMKKYVLGIVHKRCIYIYVQ